MAKKKSAKLAETDATMESARMAVAVGCCATESLRNGGVPIDVPQLKSN